MGKGRCSLLEDGLSGITGDDFLGKICPFQSAGHLKLFAVHFHVPGKDTKQGTFACTINPDKAYSLARSNGAAYPVKEEPLAQGHCEISEFQHFLSKNDVSAGPGSWQD